MAWEGSFSFCLCSHIGYCKILPVFAPDVQDHLMYVVTLCHHSLIARSLVTAQTLNFSLPIRRIYLPTPRTPQRSSAVS